MSWAALTEQLRKIAKGFSSPCADKEASTALFTRIQLLCSGEDLLHRLGPGPRPADAPAEEALGR